MQDDILDSLAGKHFRSFAISAIALGAVCHAYTQFFAISGEPVLARLALLGGSLFAGLFVFGGFWLVLMFQVWVGMLPAKIIRAFVGFFFFVFSLGLALCPLTILFMGVWREAVAAGAVGAFALVAAPLAPLTVYRKKFLRGTPPGRTERSRIA